jgi:hypothetical protein
MEQETRHLRVTRLAAYYRLEMETLTAAGLTCEAIAETADQVILSAECKKFVKGNTKSE